MFKGNGYLGSSSPQVSKANQELIPAPPSNKGWTYGYKLYKFSFNNEEDVTIIINGDARIYLKAGQGFEIDQGDAPISSFVIVEPSKNYNWIGAY